MFSFVDSVVLQLVLRTTGQSAQVENDGARDEEKRTKKESIRLAYFSGESTKE